MARSAFPVAVALCLLGLAAALEGDSAFVPREALAQEAGPGCEAASGAPASFASDKTDYAFNELAVVIKGDGLDCGGEYRIRVTRPDGVEDADVAVADETGHLEYEYWVNAGGGTYFADLSSADGATLLATTSFSWSSVMVVSDKTDYRPGETVTITGSDFGPGESVQLHLQVEPKTHADQELIATADARGDFVNDDYVVQEEDLGVTFLLRALGLSSGLTAQTTFTDHTGLFFSTFGGADESTVIVDGWSDSDAGGGNAVVDHAEPRDAVTNTHYARLRQSGSLTRLVDTTKHDHIHLKFFCRGDNQAENTDVLRVLFDLNGDLDFADANEGPHTFTLDTAGTTGAACPDGPDTGGASTWSAQKDIDLSAISALFNNNPNLRIRFQGVTNDANERAHVDDVEVTGIDMCGNGVVESSAGEACDEGAANGTAGSCCSATCTLRASGSTCRASAGVCDVAETCSGTSPTCPVDAFELATTACRGAAGQCDEAELCSGASAECPVDALKPATFECRAAAGTCDVAETCSGNAVDCPVDALKPATEECRASAGECDVAEKCTGTAVECPVDAFKPASDECRPTAGICDVAESCSGSSATCPTDAFKPSSEECRGSAGDCDVAESCTGSGAECPNDAFRPATHECRGEAGICDVAETCTGSGAVCPADVFEPATQECRGSAGICDLAENCSGDAAACPVDVFKPTTEVCRGEAGVCDVVESCTGTGAECPNDAFKPATEECRGAAGVCDLSESCTGSGAECPNDAKSTAECRGSAGICDVAESCDGVGNDCPVDAFQPSTHECRGSAGVCDPEENCTGAAAACPTDAKSTALCRGAADVCDVAESCDGVNDDCPANDFVDAGVECRGSAGECDPAESCTGGGPSCPADGKSTAECRGVAGECDVAESCDGVNDDCPADDLVDAGVECRGAAGECDLAESCSGADPQCPSDAKSTAECRGATGECDVAEDCDGVSDDCPTDVFVPDGTSCTDPDTCQLDACQTGECTSGAIPWSGVLQPINQDGSSIFKLGSTIPVKFRLTNECANVSLVAKIYLRKIDNGIEGTQLEATSTSAADTGNTFRWSDGQFIFNLATKPLSAGTWKITIDLGDGFPRSVLISLKK